MTIPQATDIDEREGGGMAWYVPSITGREVYSVCTPRADGRGVWYGMMYTVTHDVL